MPTALLRHSVTETADIAAAIDAGQVLWPQATRSQVLHHLIVGDDDAARHTLESRQAAVRKWAGCFTGMYPTGAAQMLKDEWPD